MNPASREVVCHQDRRDRLGCLAAWLREMLVVRCARIGWEALALTVPPSINSNDEWPCVALGKNEMVNWLGGPRRVE